MTVASQGIGLQNVLQVGSGLTVQELQGPFYDAVVKLRQLGVQLGSTEHGETALRPEQLEVLLWVLGQPPGVVMALRRAQAVATAEAAPAPADEVIARSQAESQQEPEKLDDGS